MVYKFDLRVLSEEDINTVAQELHELLTNALCNSSFSTLSYTEDE